MEEFISLLSDQCNLGEQERTQLRQTARTLHFPKGSAVIEEGKIDDSLYIIRKGVWRAFIERDGTQYTLWFGVPGEFIFSSWGYLKGLPSRLTISSSSDSMALEVKKKTLMQLSESSPAVVQWLQNVFGEVLLGSENAVIDLSSPKAENRYLAFMKKMPEISRHVPLKEIAGFIGVTPQSLSRIRAGLAKR